MVFVSLRFSEIQIQIQHERSPIHVQSSLNLSYGNHWNQGSNKQRVLLTQSLKNQSGQSLISYALEVKPYFISGIFCYTVYYIYKVPCLILTSVYLCLQFCSEG